MAYCREQSAVKREQHGFTAVSLPCKSWGCPDCQDNRKRQLTAQAMGGAPYTFLTLTSRRKPGKSANAAALELSRAWRLIRLRLMRKYRWKALPFLAVVEATKLGWPHLHILLRVKYIPWQVLSAWMAELHDSPVVDIKHIDNQGRVAGYVAKYCSKCVHKFGTAKRYWQSRDYDIRDKRPPKPKFAPGWGWELDTVTLQAWITGQIQLDRQIVMKGPDRCEAHFPNDWSG